MNIQPDPDLTTFYNTDPDQTNFQLRIIASIKHRDPVGSDQNTGILPDPDPLPCLSLMIWTFSLIKIA